MLSMRTKSLRFCAKKKKILWTQETYTLMVGKKGRNNKKYMHYVTFVTLKHTHTNIGKSIKNTKKYTLNC
jgi:hypothetical protein